MTQTRRAPIGAFACLLLAGLSVGSGCGEFSELPDRMSIPTEGKSIFETTLEQVNPNEGPTIGGIQLDISGTGFAVGATVSVKGVSASDVTVWSSTRITATLPKQPGFAGDAPIVVTNPDGSSARRSDLFRYYLGAFPFRAPLLELGDQAAQFADATAVATGDLNQDGVPDIAARWLV